MKHTPRRNSACSNKSYVNVDIFDTFYYALVDSGSPVTIIDESVVPETLLSNLTHSSLNLTSANGTKLETLGNLSVKIGFSEESSKLELQAIVARNLCETILIGSDFLTDHSCILNYSNLTFTVNDLTVPLLKAAKSRKPRSFKVKVTKTVTIPPKTIANNILCSTLSKDSSKRCYISTSGILDPADKLLSKKFNFSLPNILLNVKKGSGYINITNPHATPVTIYRNQIIGVFHEVQEKSVNFLNKLNVPQHQVTTPVNTTKRSPADPNTTELLFKKLKIDENKNISDEQRFTLKQLISKYQHIFYTEGDILPEANLPEHEIIMDTNKPIQVPYRQIPLALKPQAEKLVKDLMDKDVIEPSNSPYHSPAFVIRRGDKYRIVVDYRLVNKHVIRNYQPLPSIDTITTVWHNCKYWSTLDLHHAYFQIKLSEKSRPITACSIPGVAFFQFKRIPLGVSSAVGYFQGLIEKTLMGLKNNLKLVAYMDDIATGSPTFEEMISNLEQIFKRLSDVGLLLKPEKTKLLSQELVYLGLKLTPNGLQVNPEKTAAVANMQIPKNSRDVKSFLGFCSFYRKFIMSFSDIVKALTNLTKNNTKFRWGPLEQKAFDTIKQKLIEAPILKFPDLNKQFVLTCDASMTGISGILSQYSDDGKFLHPVAYGSNTLNETQSKWSAFQREFYALRVYCEKFKQYLIGRKFLVRTDNEALVNWQKVKNFDNPKLWRWFVTLSSYDFDIQHVPGAKNESDGLSRLPQNEDVPFQKPSEIKNSINAAISSQLQDDQSKCSHQDQNTPDLKAHIQIIDIDRLKHAQNSDENLKTVVSWVLCGTKPPLDRNIQKLNPTTKTYYNSFTRLKVKDGVLLRTWEKTNGESPDDLICVPDSLTEEIIKLCHDIPSGGHLGKPKTLSKIQTRFYWPKMELQISLYIDACDVCIKKSHKKKLVSPLQPFNGTHPNDIMQFDILENMPPNPQNFTSILVMVCRFTCWPEAVPLRNTKATTVAKALLDNWIARQGCPIQCHSDRGPQFTSEVMRIVYDLMGIHKTYTCAYRPSSDGAAEAVVKNVKNLLKGFCMENSHRWPDLLQQCLFAYRTSKHSSTGYSPFFLHRGHNARIPLDILFNTFNQKKFTSREEYAYDLFRTLKQTYSYVEKKLGQNRVAMKKSYDKRVHIIPYQPGQYVYVWRPRPPHNKNKFFDNFFGPFRIIKKITDYTYQLDIGSKSRMYDIVPHDLLKLAPNQPNTGPTEVNEYDPPKLDLDHRLEMIPEQPEPRPAFSDQVDNQVPAERPVIVLPQHQDNNIVAPRQLRLRAALRRPEYYQAGY